MSRHTNWWTVAAASTLLATGGAHADLLGLNAQLVDPQYQDAMDALFAGMDTDRSGHIDYKELNSSLRQGQFQRRTVSRNAAPSTRTVGFHPANKSPPPKEGGPQEGPRGAEGEEESAGAR